ncbi:MAG TPA: hypothetical protein VGB53_02025, partial [Rubricoccaceae bacterium]
STPEAPAERPDGPLRLGRRLGALTDPPAADGAAAGRVLGGLFTDISTSPTGPSVNGQVTAVALGPDGTFTVGGTFSEAGGRPVANVARWDGAAWQPLGSGLGALSGINAVSALVTGPDGSLYAGGGFKTAGGATVSGVARWDGAAWQVIGAARPGAATPGDVIVNDLVFGPTGDLYAGGYFTTMNGVAARNVARWDGAAWSALGGSVGVPSQVNVLHVASDGGLYAGGLFGSDALVRWDGTG